MAQPQDWRAMLRKILEEENKIVPEIVSQRTAQRWLKGDTFPQHLHLKQVLAALPTPALRTEFARDLIREYPFLAAQIGPLETVQVPEIHIPSEYLLRVLNIFGSAPAIIRDQALLSMAAMQLISLIAVEHVVVLSCYPSSLTKKIILLKVLLQRERSLAPLLKLGPYLGAESLAGAACSVNQILLVDEVADPLAYPLSVPTLPQAPGWAQSMACCPVSRGETLCGALLLFSQQPAFFTPERVEVIRKYCFVFLLAWKDEEFYPFTQLELAYLPFVPFGEEDQRQQWLLHLRERLHAQRQAGFGAREAEQRALHEMIQEEETEWQIKRVIYSGKNSRST